MANKRAHNHRVRLSGGRTMKPVPGSGKWKARKRASAVQRCLICGGRMRRIDGIQVEFPNGVTARKHTFCTETTIDAAPEHLRPIGSMPITERDVAEHVVRFRRDGFAPLVGTKRPVLKVRVLNRTFTVDLDADSAENEIRLRFSGIHQEGVLTAGHRLFVNSFDGDVMSGRLSD